MKKLKILYVGGLNANQKGAIGTHTAGVIRALNNHSKVEVTGLFIKDRIPNTNLENLILFDKKIKDNTLNKILFLAEYIKFIKKKCKEKKYDFIYMRFDPFISPFVVNHFFINEYNDIYLTQIKIACSKGEWNYWAKFIRKSLFYKLYINWSEKKTFTKTYCTVAVTEKLKNYCLEVINHNVIILMNGTNYRNFEENEKDKEVDYLILGHIGTLTYWDGLIELIDAIKLCLNKYQDIKIKLLIVGEGALKEEIKNIIVAYGLRDTIFLIGAVEQSEINYYFNKIDVVPILKTLDFYGLSPIKYYEAFSFGKSLLVSNIEHMNELPDFAGKIVNFPLNLEEIAREIYEMYVRRYEIRNNSKLINQYSNNHFTWEKRVDYFLETLIK